ncbi:MAG: ACT domain-containing protein, partial [Actinobacteria bacterium]|nr:ACT domain-containing protein [Actinomycetota bacterium]NIT94014.1 ACT domain-containing protein [Actinomycetota bacterium]NIV54149.1 ACT domain-containing protein [Actinomycetota bacterium]NIV85439.1 ACT domain-containing protein [Actinomycetota bacterium]NIX48999.1 ACT domain-containing protein [Actinomycetota bacterium]
MVKIATQLSVHMENRPGALADLTESLVDSGVNVLAIQVPDTGEFGTVRVLPDDVMEAKAALDEAGLPHAAADVLAVELPHQPGALARTARLLADEGVVVRYAYATNTDGQHAALVVLRVDDIHKAQDV